MKIEYFSDNFARHGFRATPGEYDAYPPIGALTMDARPQLLNQSRLAVAAFLAFFPFASGSLSLPGVALPLSAQSMELCCAPTWTRVEPIDYAPKDVPKGALELRVSVQTESPVAPLELPKASGPLKTIGLSLLRGDEYRGALMSTKFLRIASNAWLFAQGNHPILGVTAPLAVAVLFAEDLDIRSISMDIPPEVPSKALDGIQSLIRSVGIAFEPLELELSGAEMSVR